MESMSKSEFIKKFINDSYEKKRKKVAIRNEIKAYQYRVVGKNMFK